MFPYVICGGAEVEVELRQEPENISFLLPCCVWRWRRELWGCSDFFLPYMYFFRFISFLSLSLSLPFFTALSFNLTFFTLSWEPLLPRTTPFLWRRLGQSLLTSQRLPCNFGFGAPPRLPLHTHSHTIPYSLFLWRAFLVVGGSCCVLSNVTRLLVLDPRER